MRRTVYFQFESGTEGNEHFDLIDGPYAAETWQELKDQGTALLQSDEVPQFLVGAVNWYGLWNDTQSSEEGFVPVMLRWPGRWLRIAPSSLQAYEEEAN